MLSLLPFMPPPSDIRQWLAGDGTPVSPAHGGNPRNQRLAARITALGDFFDAAGWCVVIGFPKELWLSERARHALGEDADQCQTWGKFLKFVRVIPEMEVLDRQSRIAIWRPAIAPASPPVAAAPSGLTARETEIMELLVSGKTTPEISIILGCKTRTVEKHIANLYRKTGVRSRASLILATPPSSDP